MSSKDEQLDYWARLEYWADVVGVPKEAVHLAATIREKRSDLAEQVERGTLTLKEAALLLEKDA